jgi:hypothetical protein
MPRFLKQWHDTERWVAGVEQMSPVMSSLKSVCEQWLSVPVRSLCAGSRVNQVWFVSWVLGCLSWLQCCIGNLIRECWVHPDLAPGARERRPSPGLAAVGSAGINLSRAAGREAGHEIWTLLPKEGVSANVLRQCFKMLRAPKASPPDVLNCGGRLLEGSAANAAWASKLSLQCAGPRSVSKERFDDVCHRWARWQGTAWSHIGDVEHDAKILQTECVAVVSDWRDSFAMPPDLLPRALFKCGSSIWDEVCWLLLALAGPGHWAIY